MTKFSERAGAVEVPKIFQIKSMNDDLRNAIWNFLLSIHEKTNYSSYWGRGKINYWSFTTDYISRYLLKLPADELPIYNDDHLRKWLKNKYYKMEWYEIYDLVEMLCSMPFHKEMIKKFEITSSPDSSEIRRWVPAQLHAEFNRIFEAELSEYRFIDKNLVPIASPAETESIEEAIKTTRRLGLPGAHIHITTAIQLLAKRPQPDYRNSVKESISAIESMAKQLAGEKSGGLAPALQALVINKVPIHKSLQSAFSKLYGYTSDENGIRHAILEAPTVGLDEAKYMLVSCSAFVNFLAAKADAAGIPISGN
ncbi:AbiJ-NTD4 domain-containing protein [Verminephrobacter aporrectodeae]|uniref:AbiJ-NTD4 domain-containing protein n=1 Tax=Verminephrobacter aporrectodeae TaxID=1110389 RepID=UPI002238B399|nr:hypothetical protein [Verminephrobacter aporrectodeae]MCW5222070.1 hypothetical protein [Verminephrobacter aporrectodeae subsp. tuberculatae]MCW5291361.1 hypothetical protein [Verminephrobacter aporrectodeae subsp. tuberculatae]MCW8175457.1 hypothetical protein [Verminephrobacter aporrectodeae subsp. tuberculatae]MCW8201324.1 hypothetical protein [Verminephrobacter aporrectodeae subsp. tuberculatae]